MSTIPLKPTDIRCKDAHIFSVGPEGGRDRPGARVVVYASFRDAMRSSSGLSRFETFHEPGDARAEHAGMPIEIVRAYAWAHGGVAEAGPEALAFLKRLPSAAAETSPPEAPPEPEPAPVPETTEAVEEAAEPNRQARPIPAWVAPVMARLLAERADELVRDADRARVLSAHLNGEA